MSPEPFEEVKLPPVEDIESDDEDDDEFTKEMEKVASPEKDFEGNKELSTAKEKEDEANVLYVPSAVSYVKYRGGKVIGPWNISCFTKN